MRLHSAAHGVVGDAGAAQAGLIAAFRRDFRSGAALFQFVLLGFVAHLRGAHLRIGAGFVQHALLRQRGVALRHMDRAIITGAGRRQRDRGDNAESQKSVDPRRQCKSPDTLHPGHFGAFW